MKTKKKMLRNKNIWYCVWNSKNDNQSPKCDGDYHPIRHSIK